MNGWSKVEVVTRRDISRRLNIFVDLTTITSPASGNMVGGYSNVSHVRSFHQKIFGPKFLEITQDPMGLSWKNNDLTLYHTLRS